MEQASNLTSHDPITSEKDGDKARGYEGRKCNLNASFEKERGRLKLEMSRETSWETSKDEKCLGE